MRALFILASSVQSPPNRRPDARGTRIATEGNRWGRRSGRLHRGENRRTGQRSVSFRTVAVVAMHWGIVKRTTGKSLRLERRSRSAHIDHVRRAPRSSPDSGSRLNVSSRLNKRHAGRDSPMGRPSRRSSRNGFEKALANLPAKRTCVQSGTDAPQSPRGIRCHAIRTGTIRESIHPGASD